MDKFEYEYCQMDSAKETANRIVFQLNLLEDKLRYCHWTGMPDGDRTEGLIVDFQKALHNCNLVHPADVNTCDQIIHRKTDGLAITTSEIRLLKGSTGYPRYRMYTISSNDTQGNTVSINGVLEVMQYDKAIARRSKIQAQQDSLFRLAVTSNSLLSMGFDYVTGKRLVSDLDVLPTWLPKDMSLRNIAYTLFSQSLIPEDQHKLELMFDQSLDRVGTLSTESFYSDCRLRDLSKKTTDFRWYRVYHSYTGNTPKQHVCFYLTIIDIHEVKTKELQKLEQSFYDPMTGMLNRSAFENQVTNWLQRMKREKIYTYLCAVVVLIENPIEINNLQGRHYLAERIVQLGKMVKAFIHPHEMCCKYGLGEFAMVLAGSNKETLDERLKMLRFVCDAQKSENTGLRILFGCNIETASTAEQGDIFLEKAYQAMLSIRNRDTQDNILFAPVDHAPQYQEKKSSESQNIICQEDTTRHIFIRTFGHFDVFVDGEAVLFNHPKSKELFALLVDRRGGFVSATEAISCLWEDEPANSTTLARCRKAALYMRQALVRYGADSIIETVNGKRRILVDQCDCDYYHYLQHGADASRKLIGSYMNEYSWAENSIAKE